MMKPLFFILLALLSFRGHAQMNINAIQQASEVGGLLTLPKGHTTDFDNTPHVPQSGWQSGYVKAKTGKIFRVDSLRFDLYQNLIEYRFQAQTYTPTFDVMEFGFVDGNVYVNGFEAFDGLSEQTYFRVIQYNKSYILHYRRAALLDITAYNSASRTNHFDFNDFYYWLQPDGTFTRSRRLGVGLLDGIKNREKQVKEYTKANKINLKKPEGWKPLLAYYDSL